MLVTCRPTGVTESLRLSLTYLPRVSLYTYVTCGAGGSVRKRGVRRKRGGRPDGRSQRPVRRLLTLFTM